jgi:hypothetical protein
MSAVQLPATVPQGRGLFSSGNMEHPTLRVVKDEVGPILPLLPSIIISPIAYA